MPQDLHVIEHFPRCQHLLSKGLYLNAGLPADRKVTGDGNFWCGQTQTVFGPDDKLCNGEECTAPQRRCYIAP